MKKIMKKHACRYLLSSGICEHRHTSPPTLFPPSLARKYMYTPILTNVFPSSVSYFAVNHKPISSSDKIQPIPSRKQLHWINKVPLSTNLWSQPQFKERHRNQGNMSRTAANCRYDNNFPLCSILTSYSALEGVGKMNLVCPIRTQ